MSVRDVKPFCKVGDKLEFEVVSITNLFDTLHYSMQSNGISVLFKNSNPEQGNWKPKMAEAMQWIPCSERLPEKVGVYFTSRMDYEGYVVEILPFSPNEERDVEWWTDEVDAWMPLPEPYREEPDGQAD